MIISRIIKRTAITFLVFYSTIFLLSASVFSQPHSNSIEILFTANINGVVKNCHCGNPSLGGLARIISLVEQKRKSNPDLIFIDGGDALNTYKYSKLNNATLELFAQLRPDIIIPGDQEWIEGYAFLKRSITKLKSILLLSNGHLDGITSDLQYSLDMKPETKMHILSYLHVDAFDLIQKPNELIIQETRFLKTYKSTAKSDFLAVVFHGSEKSLEVFINTYPAIDLILLAHAQSNLISTKDVPVIVGAGTDGEFIRNIVIDFSQYKPMIKVSSIPVSLKITPDPRALESIKKWNFQ